MAVNRIKQLKIEDSRELVTALIGHIDDIFVDVDLKKHNFRQQLYEYLKYIGCYETILFYDTIDGLFTYEEQSLDNYFGKDPIYENKIMVENQSRIKSKFKKTKSVNTDKQYSLNSKKGFYESKEIGLHFTEKLINIIEQTKIKTALIFNSAEISFGDVIDNKFISEIKRISFNDNTNKIFVIYENESDFVEYFDSNNNNYLFANKFFRNLFIKDTNINEKNVFHVLKPMKDECRNLLNLQRLKSNIKVDWNEFDNIVDLFAAENGTLIEKKKKLSNILELSKNELVRKKVIKNSTIDFDRNILKDVKGQNVNIEIIAEDIEYWASDDNKKQPLSFFLVGKSGTGKTHTAKTFAKALESSGFELVTLRMENYKEPHSISKLLGSPPGYIGYKEKSELFTKIRINRRLVILFDEIEKAHTDVFTSLMNLVEEGILTASDGYEGIFKECILFFTSNLAEEKVVQAKELFLEKNRKGSKTDVKILKDSLFKEEIRNILLKELEKNGLTPKPEVWNRIGYFLTYSNLSDEYIIEIFTDIIIKSTQKKNITINNIDTYYLSYLIKKQQQLSSGMRGLTKEIENNILTAIKEQKLKNGTYNLNFDNENEEIIFVENATTM